MSDDMVFASSYYRHVSNVSIIYVSDFSLLTKGEREIKNFKQAKSINFVLITNDIWHTKCSATGLSVWVEFPMNLNKFIWIFLCIISYVVDTIKIDKSKIVSFTFTRSLTALLISDTNTITSIKSQPWRMKIVVKKCKAIYNIRIIIPQHENSIYICEKHFAQLYNLQKKSLCK